MGIIAKQTTNNVLIIVVAFAIGGINTLVFYPVFLSAEQYGLVVFLLASSNMLMPLIGFGINQTIIKFFSSYDTAEEKQRFMSSVIWLPFLIALIVGGIGVFFYNVISNALSITNPVIAEYTWVIYVVALATAYFEIFYAWSRVQLQSVAGNALKEIFPRLFLFVLLILLFFFSLSFKSFVIALVCGYYLRLLLMIVIAHRYYPIRLSFQFPKNFRSILVYALYIVLAASAGSLLLDIDKFMIPQIQAIQQTAFYAVAIFAATIVEVPSRAMGQILNPLVAIAINNGNQKEVENLYKKSALNLVIVSGWFFLLINLNSTALFGLLPDVGYRSATLVVLYISLAKMITMIFGCGSAIISNSSFYRISLVFSIGMALGVALLNSYWIPRYGIDGAALATLVVVLSSIGVKIMYLFYTIKIHPFSWNMFTSLLVMTGLYFCCKQLSFSGHPIVQIALLSTVVSVVYFVLVVRLKLSEDLLRLGKRLMK
jgi:O-antigen/teichoic acid export membrane protein